MKNLEILGVQEINTVEMKQQSGGCYWLSKTQYGGVGPAAEIIINTVRKPISGTTLSEIRQVQLVNATKAPETTKAIELA